MTEREKRNNKKSHSNFLKTTKKRLSSRPTQAPSSEAPTSTSTPTARPGTSSTRPWERPWEARPGVTQQGPPRSSPPCARRRGRTCSPTPSRPRWSPRRTPPWTCWRRPRGSWRRRSRATRGGLGKKKKGDFEFFFFKSQVEEAAKTPETKVHFLFLFSPTLSLSLFLNFTQD